MLARDRRLLTQCSESATLGCASLACSKHPVGAGMLRCDPASHCYLHAMPPPRATMRNHVGLAGPSQASGARVHAPSLSGMATWFSAHVAIRPRVPAPTPPPRAGLPCLGQACPSAGLPAGSPEPGPCAIPPPLHPLVDEWDPPSIKTSVIHDACAKHLGLATVSNRARRRASDLDVTSM
ncbi:hypothetical protein [Caudoviricetes sp.]|nr:hypothetical protein [Caudoviricetes sp.]